MLYECTSCCLLDISEIFPEEVAVVPVLGDHQKQVVHYQERDCENLDQNQSTQGDKVGVQDLKLDDRDQVIEDQCPNRSGRLQETVKGREAAQGDDVCAVVDLVMGAWKCLPS